MNQHIKNERIYFLKSRGESVLQQVVDGLGQVKEQRRKLVQMKVLFNTLRYGQPMADYTAIEELLIQLNLAELPRKHWSKIACWEFATTVVLKSWFSKTNAVLVEEGSNAENVEVQPPLDARCLDI